jgi:sugar-specific transcriptional regulator TrmB
LAKKLSIEEEATQILNRLGLTISQARIYLALLKLEKATAKTISKHSKVARQEVYRILVEIEEKSLVERIIATPTEFKPVPIENGLPFLIEEKRKNMSEIQKEANKLLLRLRILVKPKETPREEKTEFILVPENKALLLRMKRAVDASQNNIDVIYPKEEFLQVLFNLSDKFQNALERGAKIRCLLNEPLDANSWPVTVQFIAENPFFEIRIMSGSSEEKIWVYDKKEMLVSTCPQCGHAQAPFLWTNAASCIKLAQNYFNISWKKAAKVKI